MVSFSEDDARWQVLNCDFEIIFRLNYGNRNIEYKSWINVREHWHLKEWIVSAVLKRNMLAEHWV